MKLTKYEKELQAAIQKGEFEILKLNRKEREKYRDAARVALAKDKSITIRINGNDLKAIKDIAVRSGKKYQTYIGDILHEHISKRSKAA